MISVDPDFLDARFDFPTAIDEAVGGALHEIRDGDDVALLYGAFEIERLFDFCHACFAVGGGIEMQAGAVFVVYGEDDVHAALVGENRNGRAQIFSLKGKLGGGVCLGIGNGMFEGAQGIEPLRAASFHERLFGGEVAVPIFLKEFQKFWCGTELFKVAHMDERIDAAGVEGGVFVEPIEDVREGIKALVARAVEGVGDAGGDVFYRAQRVGDGVGFLVESKGAVVLTKAAGGDADAKGALHFILDLGDLVLVALLCVVFKEDGVVFEGVVRLEIRAVDGVNGDGDGVGVAGDEARVGDEVVRGVGHFDVVGRIVADIFNGCYRRCCRISFSVVEDIKEIPFL